MTIEGYKIKLEKSNFNIKNHNTCGLRQFNKNYYNLKDLKKKLHKCMNNIKGNFNTLKGTWNFYRHNSKN
jgi:hypothetical protein